MHRIPCRPTNCHPLAVVVVPEKEPKHCLQGEERALPEVPEPVNYRTQRRGRLLEEVGLAVVAGTSVAAEEEALARKGCFAG